ncbi:alpha/beta-hydrolase [Auricularia subglabra TFB-10046 SS5]|nr:alpha/beta-hydrolase [Auricularia subglabra TFB-10046 SS5]
MAFKLTLIASFVAVALASGPRCVDSIARFTASATNYDLSGGTLPPNPTLPVSGTYGIQLRYCEPAAGAQKDVLQVLVHGISYGTEYWDSGFEPKNYSYARYAAAQGYATLNMARLGYGKSDHPDPAIVQAPFDIAILESIIKAARKGKVLGASHAFGKVVYVGHSYGSILGNGLIIDAPTLVDAIVFTGFGHDLSKTGDVAAIAGVGPARDIDPARFGNLPPDYLTTANISTRAASLYGPVGTFDPAALAFDEATKDTTTTAEFATLPVPVTTAPDFGGDVFTVNGDGDVIFCTKPLCANIIEEKQFYPKAKSVQFAVIRETGHSLNFHLSAPEFYDTLQTWLTNRGY